MKWEIKALEDAVRSVHGDRYADEIHGPLQSFVWKSDIAYYHACESERVIKEALASTDHIGEDDPGFVSAAKAILLAASPDGAGSHILAGQFKAEAHIIASAQALHSLCDIISGVVYWAFQLDTTSSPLPVNRLNLHSIHRTLSTLPQYSTTANLIDAVILSSEFAYLAAYVNTTKHKCLISSTLSASFETDNRNGMRIKGFSYPDQRGNLSTYVRKWSRDFLFPENHALRLKLFAVGNSLNDHFK
jgi:hypothetical protein